MKFLKKMDDIGRLTIPKDLRKELDWNPGDEIEMTVKDDTVILLKPRDKAFELRNMLLDIFKLIPPNVPNSHLKAIRD